jgi:hypothetical protein
MSDELGTLDDVLEDIGDFDPDLEQGTDEGTEEAATTEPEAGEAETSEEPSGEDAEDTPTGEPPTKVEGEEATTVDAESTDESSSETPTEEDGTTPFEDLADETVVAQLEDGTQVTLGELRQGNLRQSDYTQKTQALAQQGQQVQQAVDLGVQLVGKLFASESARGFLEEHPDALQMLLNNPQQTMQLLETPEAFDHFWQQYDVIAQDPNLAQALVDRSQNQQAVQQLDAITRAQAVSRLGRDVAAQIDVMSAEYEGVDSNQIASYVLSLVGLTPAHMAQAAQNPLLVEQQFSQLYGLLVRRDPATGQEYMDTSVIKDRFTLLKQQADTAAATEAAKQTEHNEAVGEKLTDENVPASPSGDAPGTVTADQDWEAFKKGGGTLEDFLDEDPLLGLSR